MAGETSRVDHSIPDQWRRRINLYLENGEKILWADQPDPTMAMARHLPTIGGIALVLVVLLIGVVWIGWDQVREGRAGTIIPIVLLLLLIAAMLSLLLWQRRLARKTCYALTNQRALVFLPNFVGKLRMTSYFPDQLQNAQFQPSWLFGPEAGDWVFRQQISQHIRRQYSQNTPMPYKEEKWKTVKSFGFLMLKKAAPLEPLLRKVARQQRELPP